MTDDRDTQPVGLHITWAYKVTPIQETTVK